MTIIKNIKKNALIDLVPKIYYTEEAEREMRPPMR
jgi:hypothetical protein